MSGLLAIAMSLGSAASIAAAPQACVEVRRDLAAGALPVRSDFTAVACAPAEERRASSPVAFHYDAGAGLVRVARRLTTGEVVRAPPTALVGAVRPGSRLTVASAVGPVRIERQVEVVRAIRGGRLLVRGADGVVFATSDPEAQP